MDGGTSQLGDDLRHGREHGNKDARTEAVRPQHGILGVLVRLMAIRRCLDRARRRAHAAAPTPAPAALPRMLLVRHERAFRVRVVRFGDRCEARDKVREMFLALGAVEAVEEDTADVHGVVAVAVGARRQGSARRRCSLFLRPREAEQPQGARIVQHLADERPEVLACLCEQDRLLRDAETCGLESGNVLPPALFQLHQPDLNGREARRHGRAGGVCVAFVTLRRAFDVAKNFAQVVAHFAQLLASLHAIAQIVELTLKRVNTLESKIKSAPGFFLLVGQRFFGRSVKGVMELLRAVVETVDEVRPWADTSG